MKIRTEISCHCSRLIFQNTPSFVTLRYVVVFVQSTTKKRRKIYDVRAQSLFYLIKLLFGGVFVAVAVFCLSSNINTRRSVRVYVIAAVIRINQLPKNSVAFVMNDSQTFVDLSSCRRLTCTTAGYLSLYDKKQQDDVEAHNPLRC